MGTSSDTPLEPFADVHLPSKKQSKSERRRLWVFIIISAALYLFVNLVGFWRVTFGAFIWPGAQTEDASEAQVKMHDSSMLEEFNWTTVRSYPAYASVTLLISYRIDPGYTD